VSTRVEGAEPPVIVITAKANLVAGATCLVLTVWQENGNLYRYSLCEQTEPRNSRLAFGKVIVAGHMAGRVMRAPGYRSRSALAAARNASGRVCRGGSRSLLVPWQ
jgi:hypothetical protein